MAPAAFVERVEQDLAGRARHRSIEQDRDPDELHSPASRVETVALSRNTASSAAPSLCFSGSSTGVTPRESSGTPRMFRTS